MSLPAGPVHFCSNPRRAHGGGGAADLTLVCAIAIVRRAVTFMGDALTRTSLRKVRNLVRVTVRSYELGASVRENDPTGVGYIDRA